MTEQSREPPSDTESAGTFERLGRKLDQRPEVQAAAEALHRAREQLEQAQSAYENVCRQAKSTVDELRSGAGGDTVNRLLEWVRRHPGPSVLAAAACGFFLGKLFRR